jgi:hypothetical protein
MEDFKLTEHFGFYEATNSEAHPDLVTKNREEALPLQDKLKEGLTELVEPIRTKFGCVIVTNGFRGPELNKAVGGVPTSQHQNAEAFDIIVPNHSNDEIISWIYWDSGIHWGQLIEEGVGNKKWIHISMGVPYREAQECMQCLKYDGYHYVPFIPDKPK